MDFLKKLILFLMMLFCSMPAWGAVYRFEIFFEVGNDTKPTAIEWPVSDVQVAVKGLQKMGYKSWRQVEEAKNIIADWQQQGSASGLIELPHINRKVSRQTVSSWYKDIYAYQIVLQSTLQYFLIAGQCDEVERVLDLKYVNPNLSWAELTLGRLAYDQLSDEYAPNVPLLKYTQDTFIPLFSAWRSENSLPVRVNMMKVLLEKGADPDIRLKDGETLLMQKKMELEIREMLLDYGASIDAVDQQGKTALHHAAQENDEERAIYFVRHGANTKLVNNNGCTASNIAFLNGNSNLASYIEAFNKDQIIGGFTRHVLGPYGKKDWHAPIGFKNGRFALTAGTQ